MRLRTSEMLDWVIEHHAAAHRFIQDCVMVRLSPRCQAKYGSHTLLLDLGVLGERIEDQRMVARKYESVKTP
jgi:hypothetical protein